MNSCSFGFLDSRFCGNDEISVFDFLFLREWRFGSYLKFKKKKRKPDGLDSRLRGNDGF